MTATAWQDVAMAVVQLLFLPTLLPMLVAPYRQKPPMATSLSTSILLILSSGILLSTGLLFGAAVQLTLGLLWGALFIQRRFRI